LIDMFEDDHEVAMQFLSTVASALMMAWDRNAEAGVLSVGSDNVEPLDGANDDEDDGGGEH
jgi:hypothetical protein